MDWSSYLLGLVTLPAALAVFLLARVFISRIAPGRRRGLGKLHRPAPGSRQVSTLEFTPRLVGQIRQRTDPNQESAKAS